jgi:hypothetical protein
VESILSEEELWSLEARGCFRKAITFNPTIGSRYKFYRSFPKPYFHIVDVESILDEEEVWLRQARVMVRMGYNFGPDH